MDLKVTVVFRSSADTEIELLLLHKIRHRDNFLITFNRIQLRPLKPRLNNDVFGGKMHRQSVV